jgi:hypothetical protein
MIAKSHPNLDDLEQFWVLFTWQQRFESLALGFEYFRSPAKLAKRFEPLNPDSWIRLTTKCKTIYNTVLTVFKELKLKG